MTTGTMTRYRNATPNEVSQRAAAAQLKQERAMYDDVAAGYALLDSDKRDMREAA